MTEKKPSDLDNPTNNAGDFRKLMAFVYGSEAAAMEVAEAALRYTTPEEEAFIQQWYDQGDEITRQVAVEAGLLPREAAGVPVVDEQALSDDEEKELTSFLEAVYRRADSIGAVEASVAVPKSSVALHDVEAERTNVAPFIGHKKDRPSFQSQVACEEFRRANLGQEYLAAAFEGDVNDLEELESPDHHPGGLRKLQEFAVVKLVDDWVRFLDDGEKVYVTFADPFSPGTLRLGLEEFELKRSEIFDWAFEVHGLSLNKASFFVDSHKELERIPISWS